MQLSAYLKEEDSSLKAASTSHKKMNLNN